jgi:3-deoxy-D-manno-octulosonic-acid transferase
MIFHLIYNLLWSIVYPLVKLWSLGNFPDRWLLRERITMPEMRPDPSLWFHCASLGEAAGLVGVLSSLRFRRHLLVTAATRSGVDFLRKELSPLYPARSLTVRIAPLDYLRTAEKFLQVFQVQSFCLYELELWPNALTACFRRGIPVFLLSARLSRKAEKLYGFFHRDFTRTLQRFTWIQAQNHMEQRTFSQLSGRQVALGTDYKAAYVLKKPPVSRVKNKARTAFAFVSLHYRELKLVLPVLPDLMKKYPILVFPRYLRDVEATFRHLRPMGFNTFTSDPHGKYIVVDTYGKVTPLLEHCHTSFVGGTLIPHGGHNLWEPLMTGCRIIMGPWYFNQEVMASDLLQEEMACLVNRPEELVSAVPGPLPEDKVEKLLKRYCRRVEIALSAFTREYNFHGDFIMLSGISSGTGQIYT